MISNNMKMYQCKRCHAVRATDMIITECHVCGCKELMIKDMVVTKNKRKYRRG